MSYLLKNIPKSTREAIDTLSQDKVITILKNAIVKYIDNFLNTTGANRSMAEVLGTSTLQYITDKSLPANVDPSIRQTQLAVLTEGLVEKIPCILVTDASTEWTSAGLGQKDDEYQEGSDLVQGFSFIYKSEINIFVVTHDEATTKDLTGLICLMFGPLQNIAGGSLIRSDDPQSAWEINLPIILPAPTFEKRALEGDTISQMWMGQLTVSDIKYENKALIKFSQETVRGTQAIVDKENAYIPPEVVFTGTVKIGQQVNIPVRFLEQHDRIVVNNVTTMAVSWEEADKASINVVGNRLGTFEVIVINGAGAVKVKKEIQVSLV